MIKEEKEKKDKKNKKCKVKEEKASKAPSTTPPPPPPGPKPIETESNLVGSGGFGSDAAATTVTTTNSTSAASDEDGTIVGGNPLVGSAENTTDVADLPYCTGDENPEGLATRGSNIGKGPIAASALGLVTILLGYMGWKRYQNRKSSSDDNKVAVAKLY
jgi:hypothetical protein